MSNDIGNVHGDEWFARIRAQHEAAGANCPCGNGHDPEPPKPWGEVWGAPFVRTSDGTIVLMRRKGQRVRFFDHNGEQIGPEHRNVVPALIWAWHDGSPLTDPGTEDWLLAGIRREIALDRDDPKIDYAGGGGY